MLETLTLGDDTIAYELSPPAPGTPIVYVHGLHSSREYWTLHAPTQQGIRQTVAIDLPSHGRSSTPTRDSALSVAGYAAAVGAVIDSLAFEQVHLVGNSVGGWVVATVATERPEQIRSVTMVGMGVRTSGRTDPAIYEVDDRTVRDIVGPRMGDIVRHRIAPEHAEMVVRIMDEATPRVIARRIRESRREFSFTRETIDVRCPLMAITGDCDRTAPLPDVVALQDVIDDFRIAVLPDCGHLPQLEEPHLFGYLLDRFLDEVDAAAS